MHLMVTRTKYKGKTYEHAKIVQSYRDGSTCRQKLILNLGPVKSDSDMKHFQEILTSMKKGEEFVKVKDIEVQNVKEFGVTYTTNKLLDKYKLSEVLKNKLSDSKTQFDVFEVVKALIINRLVEPSSDLSAYDWIVNDYAEDLDVKQHHVYRALDQLIKNKDKIEKGIFNALKKSLPLNTDIVHYDLTSSYFEGSCCPIALHGYSRDHRRDRKQIVIALAMCDSIPIMHEIFEGNTVDKTTLREMVENLKQNLEIKKPVFVADMGLITKENIEELEDEEYDYILGCQRRNNSISEKLLVKEIKTVKEQCAINIKEEKHQRNNRAYTRRHILCINNSTRKERLQRLKEIKASVEKKLKELQMKYANSQESEKGKKMAIDSLMLKTSKMLGKNKRLFDVKYNKGLKFSLNKKAWDYENSIAGKFLLVTNTKLEANEAMKVYKELQTVENAFDEIKNFLDVRPIYHYRERRVKAHVFVCVLSFLIESIIEKFSQQSARKTLRQLQRLNVVNFSTNGKKRRKLTKMQEETIFKNLKIPQPTLYK